MTAQCLKIRLRARDFYAVIVDVGEAQIYSDAQINSDETLRLKFIISECFLIIVNHF